MWDVHVRVSVMEMRVKKHAWHAQSVDDRAVSEMVKSEEEAVGEEVWLLRSKEFVESCISLG